MARIVGAMFFATAIVIAQQGGAASATKQRGSWSGYAVSLFDTWGALSDNPSRTADFFSPDKRKIVHVAGQQVSIEIDGVRVPTQIGYLTNAELMWAPDSSAFAITYTSAGALGPWHVNLYTIAHGQLEDRGEISRLAAHDYEARIHKRSRPTSQPAVFWESADYCAANVVAVKWTSASQLAMAALVPNTSRCRRMSDWDGYVIAIPNGEIVERVPARSMVRRFGKSNVPIIEND